MDERKANLVIFKMKSKNHNIFVTLNNLISNIISD